jgi:outer membrane receptor for monomeric catechols
MVSHAAAILLYAETGFSLSRESTENREYASNAFHLLAKQITRKIPAQRWE